jgi:Aromatic-ring-opening dioxygenase LigAB, LigA subunit
MSVYGVHKLLKRIRNDGAFRERLVSEPRSALAEYPLTDAECSALLAGEVGALNRMGVHGYMLNTLARYQLFGLTPQRYMEAIRR